MPLILSEAISLKDFPYTLLHQGIQLTYAPVKVNYKNENVLWGLLLIW
jgi:hypothetical protein